LLSRLGRNQDALEAAWADFCEHPSTFSYKDLMAYVPRGERSSWRTKATEAAKEGDLDSLIELLVATREQAELANVVRRSDQSTLEGISHHVTEPAALLLAKQHPDAAARLWSALGMRIVNAKKSKYYHVAVEHFERGRRCYARAGLASEWEQIVRHVRDVQHRKLGFMSEFRKSSRGFRPAPRTTFPGAAARTRMISISPNSAASQ